MLKINLYKTEDLNIELEKRRERGWAHHWWLFNIGNSIGIIGLPVMDKSFQLTIDVWSREGGSRITSIGGGRYLKDSIPNKLFIQHSLIIFWEQRFKWLFWLIQLLLNSRKRVAKICIDVKYFWEKKCNHSMLMG